MHRKVPIYVGVGQLRGGTSGDLLGYIITSLCLETAHLIFMIRSLFTLLILYDLDTLITIGSHRARHLTSPIRSSHLRIWNLIRGSILEIVCESSPWQSHRPDSQPLMEKGPRWGMWGVGNCSSGLPMAYYFWFLWLGESLLANDFMSMLFKLVAVFSTKIILIKKEICCLSDLGQNILNSHKFPIYKISISFSALFNLLGLLNGIKYMKFYKSCEKPYKYM